MAAEDEEDLIDTAPTDSETVCSVCYAEFLDPEDLVVHMNQVHLTDSGVKCQFCSSIFRGIEDYALHLRDFHILSLAACKYCTKIFTDFVLLKAHERKHKGLERKTHYNCSQCLEQFSNLHLLQKHETTVHDNDLEGVVLNKCFPLLSSFLNITALSFIQSYGQNVNYICTYCVYTGQSPDDYVNHLQRSRCRSLVCDNCCKVYKDKKGLLKHITSHRECANYVSQRDLIKRCPKCEQDVHVYTFNEHIQTCKPLKCNLCHIFLDNMDKMAQHQASEHPMAITMTKCKFCHKEFVGNVALQKHVDRKHKPEYHLYKYMCIYCTNMYFKHPKNLFCHFFSKHLDLQPYSCKICNLTFRVRKKFTIHIKLKHNSVGFVEFDEKYHVYFTDKKSENPFHPKSLFIDETEENTSIANEVEDDNLLDQTEAPTEAPTDVPTDVPTDAPTDTEDIRRKPPKIRFKEEKKYKYSKSVTVKSEVQSEGNQTENETKQKSKVLTRKSRVLKRKREAVTDLESDSDDEPLIQIKKKSSKRTTKRGVRNSTNIKDIRLGSKKQFTCKICQKYCYTFQNYKHHMSLHDKDECKKCIKCSKEFSSEKGLNKHISEKHASSKLTETLKNLLERRKLGKDGITSELSTSEKFRRTIKRVKAEPVAAKATIKETSGELSVKNFIETFTPEETNKERKPIEVEANVSITRVNVNRKLLRPPSIKMIKFVPKPLPTNVKLALPVRFKAVNADKPKLNIKLVQNVYTREENDGDDFIHDDGFEYEEETVTTYNKNESVPEVAQEVMLETQEQQPNQEKKNVVIPHKILLPKLPENYPENEIKIAHLLTEAPFYKIVKIKDVLAQPDKDQEKKEEEDEDIKLPGGTKLVNVNPLAHLLGNTPVEKLIGPSSNKAKTENFEKAIAKALLKLESRRPARKTERRKGPAKKALEEIDTTIEALDDTLEIEQ